MRRIALALVALGATQANAQPVTEVVEGAGVKVGEGTVVHPILEVQTGVVHNVFFEDNDPETSGLLRIIGELATGSLPSERLQAPSDQEQSTENYGDLAFRLELAAQYEEYLSTNENVRAQRDLGIFALARGLVFPRQTWQFGFSDEFRRENRPVNFESKANTDRDINRVALELRYRPAGRTISGSLRYNNLIDYFEDEDQQFANRIHHIFGVEAGWKVLPVTRIAADVSLGYAGPLGSESTRPSSMPLRINASIATALTVKTGLNGRIGFGKGFYETGPDFTNVVGGLQLSYRFTPQARLAAMYEYDFHDSINANFYRDHALKVRMEQQYQRFAFSAAAELRFRLYRGVIPEAMGTTSDREDVIFSVPLGATYNFRNWIAATLDYRFITDQTDFEYLPQPGEPMDDPSYTRHSLMLGVRAAY